MNKHESFSSMLLGLYTILKIVLQVYLMFSSLSYVDFSCCVKDLSNHPLFSQKTTQNNKSTNYHQTAFTLP